MSGSGSSKHKGPQAGSMLGMFQKMKNYLAREQRGILLAPAVPPRGLQCPLSSIILTRCLVTEQEVIDVMCTGHTPFMEPLKCLPGSFGAFFSGHCLI